MKHLFDLKDFQYEQQLDPRIDLEIAEIKKNLSEYRYQHSLEVATLSLKLWQKFFHKKTQLRNQVLHAALLHDFTKEWKVEQHIRIAKTHKLDFTLLRLPIALHHAFTGALIAQDIFLHNHRDILAAIRYHTTGACAMPMVAKIVYCADYLASAQISWKEIEVYSLNELVFLKTQHTLQKLIKKKLPVAKDSYELYQSLAVREKGK